MQLLFQWDEVKAEKNLRKHRVDFETASQVFFDPLARIKRDRTVDGEVRWQALGMVNDQTVLVVVHTVADCPADAETEMDAATIRIISARKADRKERKEYEQDRYLQG